ncbi:unnamed protein product [Cylicocyclus nassatus]|uniref:Uncharacterized protein n=1 Tax=Cylicocyclus nassatus TaxID=53992 RepID=A0AA36DM42_CYLNA|nr:unnamed protein product [Cylicocyclus nassatus]
MREFLVYSRRVKNDIYFTVEVLRAYQLVISCRSYSTLYKVVLSPRTDRNNFDSDPHELKNHASTLLVLKKKVTSFRIVGAFNDTTTLHREEFSVLPRLKKADHTGLYKNSLQDAHYSLRGSSLYVNLDKIFYISAIDMAVSFNHTFCQILQSFMYVDKCSEQDQIVDEKLRL